MNLANNGNFRLHRLELSSNRTNLKLVWMDLAIFYNTFLLSSKKIKRAFYANTLQWIRGIILFYSNVNPEQQHRSLHSATKQKEQHSGKPAGY